MQLKRMLPATIDGQTHARALIEHGQALELLSNGNPWPSHATNIDLSRYAAGGVRQMRKLVRAVAAHLAHIKVLPSNLAYQGFAQVLSRGSFIVAGMLISNSKGIEVYGHVQYFYLTATTFATYLSLGLGGAANRFFSVNLLDASVNRRNEMAITLVLTLGVALGMFSIAVGASDEILGSGYAPLGIAFGSMVCALFLQGALEGILAAQKQFQQILFLNLFSGLGLLAAIYFLTEENSNPDDLILAFTAVTVFACVIYFVFLSMNSQIRGLMRAPRQWKWGAVGRVFELAVPVLLIGVVNASTPWLISRFMRQEGLFREFGIFAISLQWFSAVLYLPLVMTRVLAPEIVREVDQGSHNRALLCSRVRVMGLTAAVLAATVMLLSPKIVALYMTAEVEDILRFCLMMASGIFASSTLPFASYMIAAGFAWKWLIIHVVLATLILAIYVLFASLERQFPEAAYCLGYLLVLTYLMRSNSCAHARLDRA